MEQGPKCFTQWAHAVTMARGEVATTLAKASGRLTAGNE